MTATSTASCWPTRPPTSPTGSRPADEQFLRRDGQVFRRNEIWRRVIDRASGIQVGEQLVTSNCALVVYEPAADVEVIDV